MWCEAIKCCKSVKRDIRCGSVYVCICMSIYPCTRVFKKTRASRPRPNPASRPPRASKTRPAARRNIIALGIAWPVVIVCLAVQKKCGSRASISMFLGRQHCSLTNGALPYA